MGFIIGFTMGLFKLPFGSSLVFVFITKPLYPSEYPAQARTLTKQKSAAGDEPAALRFDA